MVQRKEIRVWGFADIDKSDWFLLNSTPKKRGSKYWHEVAAADWFSIYLPLIEELGGSWADEPRVGKEHADRGIKAHATAYLEVDAMTEDMRLLYEKVDQYITYSRETGKRFNVIFDFLGEQSKAQKRAIAVLKYAQEQRRGSQFMATTHNLVMSEPEGKILVSPVGSYTVSDVLSGVI